MYSQIVLRIHKQIYRYSHVKTSGSSVWSKILNVGFFHQHHIHLKILLSTWDSKVRWLRRCRRWLPGVDLGFSMLFPPTPEIWGFVDRMTWLKHPWPGPGECCKGDFSTKGSWLLSALESLSCCSLYSPMCLVVSRIVTLLSSYQVLWAKK